MYLLLKLVWKKPIQKMAQTLENVYCLKNYYCWNMCQREQWSIYTEYYSNLLSDALCQALSKIDQECYTTNHYCNRIKMTKEGLSKYV